MQMISFCSRPFVRISLVFIVMSEGSVWNNKVSSLCYTEVTPTIFMSGTCDKNSKWFNMVTLKETEQGRIMVHMFIIIIIMSSNQLTSKQ